MLPSVHDSSMLTRRLNGMLLLDYKFVSPLYYVKNMKICRTWEIQIWLDPEQFPRVFFFFLILFYSVVPFPVFKLILTSVFTCVNFILPQSGPLLQHILVSLIWLLEQNYGNFFQCKVAHCVISTVPHLLQPVESIYFS